MRTCGTLASILLLTVACGSESESPSGNAAAGQNASTAGSSGAATGGTNGGSTGTGGIAGSNGGTGGASGPAKRGAMSLSIIAPAGCPLTEQFLDFPNVEGGHPVTDTARTVWLTDGDTTESGDPVAVTCRVAGNTPQYVLGQIRFSSPQGDVINVAVSGVIPVGEEVAPSFIVTTPELGDSYGGACTATLFEVDPVARSFWGTLTCSTFEGLETPGTCSLGASYFAFENCGSSSLDE
jgi:hypothetical protein